MHTSAAGKFLLANPWALASNGKPMITASGTVCPFSCPYWSLVTSREERISFHLKNNHFLSYSQKQVFVTECMCVQERACIPLPIS